MPKCWKPYATYSKFCNLGLENVENMLIVRWFFNINLPDIEYRDVLAAYRSFFRVFYTKICNYSAKSIDKCWKPMLYFLKICWNCGKLDGVFTVICGWPWKTLAYILFDDAINIYMMREVSKIRVFCAWKTLLLSFLFI